MKSRGFTLVELVMVITITGIIAATVTIFLKPAIDSYFDTRRRADLTDMADTALRRMGQDIRRAVPNSIRLQSSTCFSLVPTVSGGRYRMAPDTVNDGPSLPCAPSSTCSAPLSVAQATSVFDVLTPLPPGLVKGDWVVIGNQNTDDVYAGTNRAQIGGTPTMPRASDGLHRITVAAKQFPLGYDGGRFVMVANSEQVVYYRCSGGTLYRSVTTFTAASCLAGGSVVATDVENCTFVYDPNLGATQQSGFVWMRLELGRSGENVAMAHGVHVDNVP